MPVVGARGTASRGYFGGGTIPSAPTITSSTQGVASLSIAFDEPAFNGGLVLTKYERAVSTDGSTFSGWVLASSSTSPPTSPVTVSGLTNGQAYHVKIRAVNSLGPGPESNVWNTTTTPRTTPGAPTLNSVTRGYRQLTANFSAPAFNGGSAITNYEFSTNNGTTWTSMGQSGTANYIITGLADFTSYNVRVRAVNVAGAGAESNMVTAVTAGVTNAPAGLSAGSNGVFQSVLSWTAPDSNASPISDYVVQRSTSSNFSSDIVTFADGVSTSTSTTVTSLAAGTLYYFRVASVNEVGQSGWSSIASATTANVPNQVATPTSSAGDDTFTISWSAPANNGSAITGYRYQLSSNSGASWGSEGTTTSTSHTFTVSNGTSYVGRVQAYNAVGDGAYSSASTARTPTFAAPTFSASSSQTVSSPGVRTISWSGDPTNISGSTADTGTTVEVYILWTLTSSRTATGAAEQLVATYTGNKPYSGSATSFTNSGTVIQNEQYVMRSVQYDGAHQVASSSITIDVAPTQTYQPPSYNDWVYTGSYTGTTGVFDVNGQNFLQTSTYSIPGISNSTTPAVGNQRYRVTSLTIQAWTQSGTNTSTSLRWFTVGWSGTTTSTFSQLYDSYPSTNFTAGSGGSEASPGATANWNITNVDYGAGAGAGKIRVDGRSGTTGNTATHPWSPIIYVKIKINGDYQTYSTITPSPVYY
jgi:titin